MGYEGKLMNTSSNQNDDTKMKLSDSAGVWMKKYISVRYIAFSLVGLVLSACVPDPELTYPDPAQDFSVSIDEPTGRSDAQLADLIEQDLSMDQGGMMFADMDMELELDLGVEQFHLRTEGLHFIGTPQSTFNGEVPQIRGSFLWVIPLENQKSSALKSSQVAKPNSIK